MNKAQLRERKRQLDLMAESAKREIRAASHDRNKVAFKYHEAKLRAIRRRILDINSKLKGA